MNMKSLDDQSFYWTKRNKVDGKILPHYWLYELGETIRTYFEDLNYSDKRFYLNYSLIKC